MLGGVGTVGGAVVFDAGLVVSGTDEIGPDVDPSPVVAGEPLSPVHPETATASAIRIQAVRGRIVSHTTGAVVGPRR